MAHLLLRRIVVVGRFALYISWKQSLFIRHSFFSIVWGLGSARHVKSVATRWRKTVVFIGRAVAFVVFHFRVGKVFYGNPGGGKKGRGRSRLHVRIYIRIINHLYDWSRQRAVNTSHDDIKFTPR